MRNQYLLIRRLGLILRTRMTGQNHLAQVNLTSEHRGSCLPPSKGCHAGCIEAQELVALTEPYMTKTRDLPKPLKPLRPIALKRPARRRVTAPRQPTLFSEQEAV